MTFKSAATLDSQFDESFKIAPVADIGHPVRGLTAGRGNVVHDRRKCVLAASPQHDKSPAFCEQFRRRAADPTACAGNGDDLALETQCDSPSPKSAAQVRKMVVIMALSH